MKNCVLNDLRVVALAGGVGGAKLVDGLSKVLPPENLTVIVNTGDDFIHFGLTICPDIDTVMYTLAGKANPVTGWGVINETWQMMANLSALDAPTWFQLGDQDLATHLLRTQLLCEGYSLTQVIAHFSNLWQITVEVLPMCNEPFRTKVHTQDGRELAFQEYFVKEHFQPEVKQISFNGIEQATLSKEVATAIERADLVVFCPSNPFVSINPILQVADLRSRICQKLTIGVSPIISGEVIKGPAAKMFREMGMNPSARSVAEFYGECLNSLLIDEKDAQEAAMIEQLGIITYVTDIMMHDVVDRKRLAAEVLTHGLNIFKGSKDQ